MTETAKHTPGPWEIDSSRVHTSIEADGLHVAMVSYGNVTMETHLANARLIAAAPELLEALVESLENWGDDAFDVEYPPQIEWAKRANSAIKAAMGRDIFAEWEAYEQEQTAIQE